MRVVNLIENSWQRLGGPKKGTQSSTETQICDFPKWKGMEGI